MSIYMHLYIYLFIFLFVYRQAKSTIVYATFSLLGDENDA